MTVRVMVCFVVWCVARLPVAVPDFHEVVHHDDSGQTCLYHDHLTRWHGEEPHVEPDHQAFLHWHWLIPGFSIQEHDEEGLPTDDGPVKSSTEPMLMMMPETDCHDAFATFLANSGRTEIPLIVRDLTTGFSSSQFRLLARWPDFLSDSIGLTEPSASRIFILTYRNLEQNYLTVSNGTGMRLRC
jgi:hypothetical protein